jgi:hypothetical protein
MADNQQLVKPNAGGSAKEMVNHPAHYGGDTTYEVIKVLRAWSLNFALGNAVKYIARAGKKNLGGLVAKAKIEDLKKAIWYLNNEVEALEKEILEENVNEGN